MERFTLVYGLHDMVTYCCKEGINNTDLGTTR